MRNKFGLAFLLLLFTFPLAAQTGFLEGFIVNENGDKIAGATIVSLDNSIQTTADNQGFFSVELKSSKDYIILFSYNGQKAQIAVNLQKGERLDIGIVTIKASKINVVTVKNKEGQSDFGPTRLAPLDYSRFVTQGGVTNLLAYTTAATSNNELTANYNVRGGNYDENLIYIDGFEIQRPFLTRSGQQEGMSFINSNMVDNVSFSAGGFEAKYGDKLSSVLDIKYRNPDSTRVSLVAGLLGVEGNYETRINSRFSFLVGARYRSNGYLLNTLPTKGEYHPVYYDAQFLTHYNITEHLRWNVLGHFSSDKFAFVPQDRSTTFGTFNQALSLKMYFDGQEQSVFTTFTGATSLEWEANKTTKLNFFASIFNTNETEKFDIISEYYINELESDPGKANYGDSVNTLGVGSFQKHARNQLKGTIFSLYHTGNKEFAAKSVEKEGKTVLQDNKLEWGAKYQHSYFNDVLSEYNLVDSAGYNVPSNPGGTLNSIDPINAHNIISYDRITAFGEHTITWNFQKKQYIASLKNVTINDANKKVKEHFTDTIQNSVSKLALNLGARAGYTANLNKEAWLTPRVALTYSPRMYFYRDGKIYRRNIKLRLASGLYYQPPVYRDLRLLTGQINPNVLAQKSVHIVAGTDIFFNMWNRSSPFKFSVEAYYKYLWDVNPYFINDVRIRYLANNNAVAYAYGIDFNLHGQFIKGVESYFKLGLLNTKINMLDDYYYTYFNAAGDTIYPGYTADSKAVDSTKTSPGYIPRPSSQLFTFGALFQDRMPKFEQLTVQLSFLFGSGLPYGPPGTAKYKDTLRQKAYLRVDLGIGYDFLYKKKKDQRKKFWKNFDDIRLNFEVFNLLGTKNVLSQTWVQDVNGRMYAVPNYLTLRRFNLKLIIRI